MNGTGKLGLVVPCLEESVRITRFLPALCAALDAAGNCRVLVVDDGSPAGEQEDMRRIVEELRPQHPCLDPLLALPRNLGKGGAIAAGWDQASDAEWLGFVDADGSVPAGEVARLLRLAREQGPAAGALFASRVLMLGRDVRRHLHRHLIGRIYATIVSTLLGIPVYDSQCGCKLVPADAWRRIAARAGTRGYAFDVELLVGLLDNGCPVSEIPVDWHEVAGGKVRLLRDSLRMFRDVLGIRRRRAPAPSSSPRA